MAVSKLDLIERKVGSLEGAWISVNELATELEASNATVYAAVSRMKKAGLKVERKNGQIRLKGGAGSGGVGPAVSGPVKKAPVLDLDLPALGTDLKVGGLTLDGAGKVSIILRNGKHSWAAELVGSAPS